jgi:spermidine synthase
MREAGLETLPYHAYVPSFGDWGFVLAADRPLRPAQVKPKLPARFLTPALLPQLFVFSGDATEVPVEPSTLDHPTVFTYYQGNARRWE